MNVLIKHSEYKALLAFVLGKNPEWVFLHQHDLTFTDEQKTLLNSYIQRRSLGEPLAKIIGCKEFYSRNFFTNQHTLDPRPDSETLIDAVKSFYTIDQPLKFLDLGVGTGCLLLTLLLEFSNAVGYGIDQSCKALEITLKNINNFALNQRAFLIQGNWAESINTQFDVIVANPPYIPTNTVLDKETLHDPHTALFAGENGMADYKKILGQVFNLLKPNGLLFLEIGYGQLQDVDLLATASGLKLKKVFQDLAGIDRVVCYCK